MPFGFPVATTATTPPRSVGVTGATTRSWVPVHQSYQSDQGTDPQWFDAPPSYAQVMEQDLPAYPAAMGHGTARVLDDGSVSVEATPRRLPHSGAVPQQVANEPAAWSSYASAAPEHPLAQAREQHKLLVRIARNQDKLETAYYRMLKECVHRCERERVLRIFCGGGLFEDSVSREETVAEGNYRHYEQKVRTLQAEYATLLTRP